MIEPLWIHIVTVAVLFVGFGFGYWYRGWADRVKVREAVDRDRREN